MAKIQVRIYSGISIDYYTLDEVITLFQRYKNEIGPEFTNVRVDSYIEYDSHYSYINIVGDREETAAEIKAKDDADFVAKNYRQKEYERLKKEFGNES